MADTFAQLDIHCIFSTKNRTDLIDADLKRRLYARMTEIAVKDKIKVHAIGGTSDHIHMLLRMPADISVSTALRRIKSGSSKWHNETFKRNRRFYWQAGYAATSVSRSSLEKNRDYILNQDSHHKLRSFKEEYILFLRKNGIPFEEKYLWS
jgi:putative transposase